MTLMTRLTTVSPSAGKSILMPVSGPGVGDGLASPAVALGDGVAVGRGVVVGTTSVGVGSPGVAVGRSGVAVDDGVPLGLSKIGEELGRSVGVPPPNGPQPRAQANAATPATSAPTMIAEPMRGSRGGGGAARDDRRHVTPVLGRGS
jgi:hypothetical protein